MNKDRRKAISSAMDSAIEGKDLINEKDAEIKELIEDMKGGESEGIRTRLLNLQTIFATASGKLDDARAAIEQAKDEEQEYYDNMPENMQSGDKGSTAEQAVSDLEEAESALQEAQEAADQMATQLEEMAGEEDKNEWLPGDVDTLESFEDSIAEIENKVDEAQNSADSAAG